MDRQELHELLQNLHTELERGRPVDGDDRDLLVEVLADIRHVLDQAPTTASPDHRAIGERLRDATRHLEESHPRLTATVEQFVEAFSSVFR